MATHRFALTISGGLAMGAYEAGVLTQLYQDIHTINEGDFGCKLIVDAISGASAGSITGLILAQALSLGYPPDKFEPIMKATWVPGPDIVAMLDPADGLEEAVFTQNRLDSLAKQAISSQAPEDPADLSNAIAIWMAVTNLEGIPFRLQFGDTADPTTVYGFSYRDYVPYFMAGKDIREIPIPTEALADPKKNTPAEWWAKCDPVAWEDAATNAVTSGSFPFAFKTKPLVRDLTRYSDYKDFKEPSWPNVLTYQVVDGGLFGNEPIGKAIDAVAYLNMIDPARAEDKRTFLIIEPNPSSLDDIGVNLEDVKNTAAPNGLGMPVVLGKIISAYFNTAFYSDFTNALQVNDQLDALDKIEGLTDHQMQQVKNAVGLNYKNKITLKQIPNKVQRPNRLAGTFFGDFGGFLEEDFRAFDYSVGQVEARAWLTAWLEENEDLLGITSTTAAKVIAGLTPAPSQCVPDLGGSTWCKNMSEDRRTQVVNAGLNRLEQLLFRWLKMGPVQKAGVTILRHVLGGEIDNSLTKCPPP